MPKNEQRETPTACFAISWEACYEQRYHKNNSYVVLPRRPTNVSSIRFSHLDIDLSRTFPFLRALSREREIGLVRVCPSVTLVLGTVRCTSRTIAPHSASAKKENKVLAGIPF